MRLLAHALSEGRGMGGGARGMLRGLLDEFAIELRVVIVVVGQCGMDLAECEAVVTGQVLREDALQVPPGDVVHGDAMALDTWLTAQEATCTVRRFVTFSPKPDVKPRRNPRGA